MWQGSCGVVSEEGIISPAYTVLTPRLDTAEPVFWNYAFHMPDLLDTFRRFSTGVASDRWRLYYKSFAKIRVRVPSVKQQQEFVSAFNRTEHSRAAARTHVKRLWDVLQFAVNAFADTFSRGKQ
jgi:type I restriction enzyme S subunit